MTHPREWHLARQAGIGASDVAAVLGVSPWKTPWQVWHDKVTPLPDDYAEPAGSLRLWLGNRLEEVVAELYSAETGIALRRPSAPYWHRNGIMFANIDFIRLNHPGHVEAKVSSFGDGWCEPVDGDNGDRIPRHYYPQVQAQLACRPAESADVAVLYNGSEFRRYRVDRDEDYVADLDEYLTSWWKQYVIGEVEPPLTAGDIGIVKARFPRDNEEERVATPEETMLVEELRVARELKAWAERREQGIEVAVRAAIGTAAKLVGPGFSISYRTSKPTERTDWKLVAETYRRIIEAAEPDAVRAALAQAAVDDLAGVVARYTDSKDGVRVFRPTWK